MPKVRQNFRPYDKNGKFKFCMKCTLSYELGYPKCKECGAELRLSEFK